VLIFSERTPNPDALKFSPHRRLTDGRGWSFERASAAAVRSPLAEALLQLAGVARVHIGEDFVTVARRPGGEDWTTLRIQVIAAIADVLGAGLPAVVAPDGEPVAASQIEDEIRQVLGAYVRPAVAQDGGDIVFERFEPEAGTLWVRMEGACGGCPSSRRTLRDGVEQIVRRYVPEVVRVEEVAAGAEASRAPAWKRWLQAAGEGAGPRRPVFRHNGRVVRD
jgi:Fe-S cluster biogenesis protein NfuA